MSIITISRGCYSRGKEVAEKVAEELGYRSPVGKLLRIFHQSRGQWKAKCKTAKRENKSLKIRLAKMTESRDRWKAKAKELEEEEIETETLPVVGGAKKHR